MASLGTPQMNTEFSDLTELKFYTAIEGVDSDSQFALLPNAGLINQINAIELAEQNEKKKKFLKKDISNLTINEILQEFTDNFFRILNHLLNYEYYDFNFKTFLNPFLDSKNYFYTGILLVLLAVFFKYIL